MAKRIMDGVVSKSILERPEKHALSLDWYCIPPEKGLLPNSILSRVAFDATWELLKLKTTALMMRTSPFQW